MATRRLGAAYLQHEELAIVGSCDAQPFLWGTSEEIVQAVCMGEQKRSRRKRGWVGGGAGKGGD